MTQDNAFTHAAKIVQRLRMRMNAAIRVLDRMYLEDAVHHFQMIGCKRVELQKRIEEVEDAFVELFSDETVACSAKFNEQEFRALCKKDQV